MLVHDATATQDSPDKDVWPPVPDGLHGRGATFWRRVVAVFEPSLLEREVLTEVARTIEVLEDLDAHVLEHGPVVRQGNGWRANPALVEQRQQRTLLGRLLGQLDLVDEDGTPLLDSPRVSRARRAARARWDQQRHDSPPDAGERPPTSLADYRALLDSEDR